MNIGAFNLGNVLSSWLGGLVISVGLGYTALGWVGATLATGAVLLALLSAAWSTATARPARWSLKLCRRTRALPFATER